MSMSAFCLFDTAKVRQKKHPQKEMFLMRMRVSQCVRMCEYLTFYKAFFPKKLQKSTGHLVHVIIRFSRLEVGGIVVPFGKRTHKECTRNIPEGFVTEGYTAIVGHDSLGQVHEAEVIAIGNPQVIVYQDAVHGLPMRSPME